MLISIKGWSNPFGELIGKTDWLITVTYVLDLEYHKPRYGNLPKQKEIFNMCNTKNKLLILS